MPLPPGLTLNSSTGVISGTPTVPGIYTYVVQVIDSLGAVAETSVCTIEIDPPTAGIWTE